MTLGNVPVTIVGGGPVGLAMGVALSRQGISSRIIDLKGGPTDHPKARGVWIRTMEILRQLGVEDRIRESALDVGSDNWVVFDGLDDEIARTEPEPYADEGPAPKCTAAQDVVEEALVWRLRGCDNVDLRWETEFLSAKDEGDTVLIEARDSKSGERLSWRTSYFVGADGGAGICAKVADITYEKTPILRTSLNTYFEADLSNYPWVRNAAGLFLRPEDPNEEPYMMLNTNGADRWLVMQTIGRGQDERERPATNDETINFIKRILRRPDLDVRIINESMWRITRRIADRFRNGRFLLVGDAAHRFPPTGGFGMTSGIEDAHNLAWKLAFVLRGQAGEALLESYDVERRPRAHDNAAQSFRNNARLPYVRSAVCSGDRDRIHFWVHDLDNHIQNVGHTLGFVYEDGALIPDGTTPIPHSPRYYFPTDRPGSRYPHMWLDVDHRRSTLDLFDDSLVLMVGDEPGPWPAAAAKVAEDFRITLPVHQLPPGYAERGVKMGPRGAALVRPDGVTAWRKGWVPLEPEVELTHVVERILSRESA